MATTNRGLLLGGYSSLAISLLHLLMIIGGSDWYRFFGAGEAFAQMAESGSLYPHFVTAVIAGIFAVWGMYALSGAGVFRLLPLTRWVLVIVTAIYLLRGLKGIPLVLFADHPYLAELGDRMLFMLVSSALSLALGIMYLAGTRQLWKS
ncbi:hypothetical protein [Spongorhabdus nitratireducens]